MGRPGRRATGQRLRICCCQWRCRPATQAFDAAAERQQPAWKQARGSSWWPESRNTCWRLFDFQKATLCTPCWVVHTCGCSGGAALPCPSSVRARPGQHCCFVGGEGTEAANVSLCLQRWLHLACESPTSIPWGWPRVPSSASLSWFQHDLKLVLSRGSLSDS